MATTAITFVPVGNPGNANDTADSNGLAFGKVDYHYNISKYETTYGQYVEFLNAVASSDPHGLFNPGMQEDLLLNGINRTGADGSYSYTVAGATSLNPTTGLNQNPEGSENKPVTYVNYLDAIRFANWMHNGKGTGSTETGAYLITTAALVGATRWNNIITYKATGDLNISVGDQAQASGLTGSGFDTRSTIRSITKKDGFTYFTVENRNSNGIANGSGTVTVLPSTHASGARYWIPTENEWYKAAYFKPTDATDATNTSGVYYDWATQNDTTPSNILISPTTPNKANTRTDTGFTKSPLSSIALGQLPDPLVGPNMLTEVGVFSGSASPYGTFDQDGNVTEWNESIYDPTAAFGDYNGSVNGTRSKRGASFYNPDPGSTHRDDGLMPNDAGYAAGFRLASASTLTPNSNPTPVTPTVPTVSSTLSSVGASCNCCEFDTDAGQIYSGVLTSSNEIWPTVSTAYGTIQLTLNKARTEAVYLLNIIGLDFGKWFDGTPRTADPGDDVSGMHFHASPNYTVGDAHIGLINPNQDSDLNITYDPANEMWTLTGKWTDSDPSIVSLTNSLDEIYAGYLYTNIHTERVALGEIRAQFTRSGSTTSNATIPGSTHDHEDGSSSSHEDSSIADSYCHHINPDEIYQSSSLYQGNGTDFMIDLSSVSLISTNVQASRSASYNTDVFFYRVVNAQGSVVDQLTGSWIKPGESGYAAAVQASKVSNITLSRQDNVSASESFTLQSDGYMLGLVATVANTGNTFYSFTAANEDGYNHFKYLSANKVGFEDVFGGGDRDHNDLIIDLSFAA